MSLEDIKKVISDPAVLAQGYRFYDGYVFRAIRHPANVFDAILIRNPSLAHSFGDAMPYSVHSLSEHIDYINKNGIDKAIIIAEDISFLEFCPTLKHLNIIPADTSEDPFDFSPLYNLSEIQSLRCATNYGRFFERSAEVDYARICGLQDVSVNTEKDVNFQRIPTLKKLSVSNYGGYDLSDLFCSQELDTLVLNSCKICTLDGLEASSKLQCLYLSNNRRLRNIEGLDKVKKTLKALHIENCAQIVDFSKLARLECMEHLFLKGSNKIPSLSFIRFLPNLKTLVFDMEIEDGDLSYCLHLSYVHCGKMRKHYNVKAKDLPKGPYYRGNEDIEPWRRVQ